MRNQTSITGFAMALIIATITGCASPPPSCPTGQTMCGDSCVNTQIDGNNCGACGTSCQQGNTCVGGKCVFACESGKAICKGSCVDPTSDAHNCGTCGHECSANHIQNPVCKNGYCGGDCESGFKACDADANNGCETNTDTDIRNCGACGAACDPLTQKCVGGQCTCANGLTACQNVCTNTQIDRQNCGGCGAACNVGEVCFNGACTLNCPQGTLKCGTCINPNTDADNCGSCGKACTYPNATGICNGAKCAFGACNAGYLDCDKNSATGCEVNGQNDPLHCGSCQGNCQAANSVPACNGGQCAIASCNNGYGDCDTDWRNGCEIKLTTDANNCGACGNVCAALQNANPGCNAGKCGLGACKPGWFDCDGNPANGCEVREDNDVNNCGACGKVCSFQNATATCTNGVCALAGCNGGFGDCDGNPANGCELNLTGDKNHCGSCKTVCDPVNAPTCSGGVCSASCNDSVKNAQETDVDCGGQLCAKCADGKACKSGTDCVNSFCNNGVCGSGPTCKDVFKNGSETDVDCGGTDCAKCAVGKKCLLNTDCVSLSCSKQSFTCLSDSCFDGITNGKESDTDCGGGGCAKCTDFRNCFVDADCASDVCTNGKCQPAKCADGHKNGSETDVDCGGACGGCEVKKGCGGNNDCYAHPNTAPTCGMMICQLVCKAGFADCNFNPQMPDYVDGCEVNIAADVKNCGACGAACNTPNGVPFCNNGVCAVASCNAGFGDCDKNPKNGCEASVTADVNNCGACGKVCFSNNGVAACANSLCSIACNAGFADCNVNPSDGCEANLNTDTKNCGACGSGCVGSCVAGKCQPGACAAGTADCNMNANDGCEVNITNDTKNCGGCGKACAVNQFCQNGGCINIMVVPDAGADGAAPSDGGVDGGPQVCDKFGDGGTICGPALYGAIADGVPAVPVVVASGDGGTVTVFVGPLSNHHAGQLDWDGDCYIPDPVVTGNAFSTNPLCMKLFPGDCDDTDTGKGNNPGVGDWAQDKVDNNCDGRIACDSDMYCVKPALCVNGFCK